MEVATPPKENGQSPSKIESVIETNGLSDDLKKTPEISGKNTPDSSVKKTHEISGKKTSDLSGKKTPEVSGKKTPDLSGKNTPDLSGKNTPEISGKRTPDISGKKTPEISDNKKVLELTGNKTLTVEITKTPDTPGQRTTRRRSRSTTPQTKRQSKRQKEKDASEAIIEEEKKETEALSKETAKEEDKKSETKEKTKSEEVLSSTNGETIATNGTDKVPKDPENDMEPLVLNPDEPDPELQFDENSDMESGKGSPVLSRCRTRRSQTRNIPTPKTPKALDTDQESDKNSATAPPTPDIDIENIDSSRRSTPKKTLDATYESVDLNYSTRAEVGSDATRLNFDVEDYMGENYLKLCRDRSIRGVSARRSIRQSSEDYLKRALKNNHEKSELNTPRSLMESITQGLKRKRSTTPDGCKKFKPDASPGLLSRLSSPLLGLTNRFRNDVASSTPKLTAYKETNGLDFDEESKIELNEENAEKKSWCSVM